MPQKQIALLPFLIITACISITAGSENRVRPYWGDEALWGYWSFNDDYVPKGPWKIVSVSQEGGSEAWRASNLIDGDSLTPYYASGKDEYDIVIDTGGPQELAAFSIVTLGRPNNAIDSRMAKYEFFVSASKDQPGDAVAAGEFNGDEGSETVVSFKAKIGQFITLKAYPRANANKEVAIRELSVVTAAAAKEYELRGRWGADVRGKAWAERDSVAETDKLGKQFLDLIFCTPDDINRSNLRNRPKLEEIGKLKAAKNYAAGLKGFRDYYFDKLRRPQNFGLPANDLHPYGRGYAGIGDFPQGAMDKDLDADRLKKQMAAADDFLKGVLTLDNGTKVTIGEPGSVDWNQPAQPYGYNTKTHQNGPYRELCWMNGFQPLFTAFLTTKDVKYAKRWVAYMDDWAMNESFIASIHPVSNHDNALFPGVTTLRMFAGIASSLPYDNDDVVPPAAFARIMKKLVLDSPLTWIVYMRSNGNGWTPGAGNMLFAMMIDEFKVAPLYFRETRRRNIEDICVLQELRDGTETHQWPGYNYLLMLNGAVLRLMDARESLPNWAQPAWEKDLHTPAWQKELIENLQRRSSYELHWATPNGEYPLVTHQEPPGEKRFKTREFNLRLVPSTLDDPTNAKLYSTLYGDGAAGEPEYTAEWFPYGGYNIARDGWKKEDGYGAMFCSPAIGCGGPGSACKNNAFGLAAYGMDLLADDVVHAYIRPTSPIQVDGKRQIFDINVPKTPWPTAHRGDLIREWTEPSPWRWHASENYNLMEGVYAGVYGTDWHNRDDLLKDVSHQRLALRARKANLWILTDRMLTAKKHDYEQIWYLPLKKREKPGFSADEIVINEDAKTIKTTRTGSNKWWSWDDLRDITVGNVNLSMYQFTDAEPKYTSKSMKSDEMYDWQRIGVTWQGEGNQQVITALFPRKPSAPNTEIKGTENDLTSIKEINGAKGVTGFEAVSPEGVRVTYLAAADQKRTLANSGIEAVGESLLIVHPTAAGGDITGIALGCASIKLKGKDVAAPLADFEFSIPASMDASKMRIEPIYRPISPVKILPESDVFVNEAEITLQCETPGTRLTYTIDGTKPTPQSTAYTAPFKIDRTRVIKARAYRAGVEKNPPQTSGTHATSVSEALFTKKLISPPENVMPREQGLKFEYAEGYWKDLWLAPDSWAIKKDGGSDLFDLSVIPADNPRVDLAEAPRVKTYALKYTGYLNVPADGVYTIHAPHNYTHLDQVPGYELQVYLGHALNPDGNGSKRDGDLNYWYPATRLHGFGTWSTPLGKGFHEIKIVYIDFRTESAKRLNRTAGLPDVVWSAEKPELLISGPGLERQPIPPKWLWR